MSQSTSSDYQPLIDVLQAYPVGTLELLINLHGELGNQRHQLRAIANGDGNPLIKAFTYSLEQPRWMTPSYVIPYLRTYEQLITKLPDGTVPAVEVAKLAFGLRPDEDDAYVFANSSASPIIVVVPSAYGQVRIYPDYDLLVLGNDTEKVYQVENQVAIIDYLRGLHFALPVNGRQLKENQDFLRKD